MKKFNHRLYYSAAATLVFLSVLSGCNYQVNEKETKTNTSGNTIKQDSIISIPDSIIQFLITSAAKDFNKYEPPTVIDVRNVKAGFVTLDSDTVYFICGEFLSMEQKDWIPFETVKTTDFEQYIGNTMYCQKATFQEADNYKLSFEIKRIMNELKNVKVD